MSKEFQKGFKQGFALGTKIGHELGQQGCGSTDIEDILKNSISHLTEEGPGPILNPYPTIKPKPNPVTKPVTPAPILVSETDPKAVSLGYKNNSENVDSKRYPKHAATQNCGNCALYQGKASDAAGPCPIFTGKLVAGTGWCVTYVKKG